MGWPAVARLGLREEVQRIVPCQSAQAALSGACLMHPTESLVRDACQRMDLLASL